MANTAHLTSRAARLKPACGRTALASLLALYSALCAYEASPHSVTGMREAAPCSLSVGGCLQPRADAEQTAPESRLLVALETRGGGSSTPRNRTNSLGGMIDRSVPRPTSAAGAPDANLPQFNRIPDTSTFAGAVGATAQTALPEPDGGPVLYTIVERPARQQVRPVLYKPATAARPTTKGSAKRYCTVTEVLRTTAAACQ